MCTVSWNQWKSSQTWVWTGQVFSSLLTLDNKHFAVSACGIETNGQRSFGLSLAWHIYFWLARKMLSWGPSERWQYADTWQHEWALWPHYALPSCPEFESEQNELWAGQSSPWLGKTFQNEKRFLEVEKKIREASSWMKACAYNINPEH